MKALLPALGGVASVGLCVALSACNRVSSEFHSDAGRYSIAFPSAPRHDAAPIDTAVGPRTFEVDSLDTQSIAYFVGYYDVPEGATASEQQILDGERHRGVVGTDARVIHDEAFTARNLRGRDVVAEKDRGTIRVRTFLARRRVYSLMVVGAKDEATDAAWIRFRDSFALL